MGEANVQYIRGFIDMFFDQGDLTALLILKDYLEEHPEWLLDDNNWQTWNYCHRTICWNLQRFLRTDVDQRLAVSAAMFLRLTGCYFEGLLIYPVQNFFFLEKGDQAWYCDSSHLRSWRWEPEAVFEVTEEPQLLIHSSDDIVYESLFVWMDEDGLNVVGPKAAGRTADYRSYAFYEIKGRGYYVTDSEAIQVSDGFEMDLTWVRDQWHSQAPIGNHIQFVNDHWGISNHE